MESKNRFGTTLAAAALFVAAACAPRNVNTTGSGHESVKFAPVAEPRQCAREESLAVVGIRDSAEEVEVAELTEQEGQAFMEELEAFMKRMVDAKQITFHAGANILGTGTMHFTDGTCHYDAETETKFP
jgi:hypothetical protein